MNRLGAHLWREWSNQRRLILATASAVVVTALLVHVTSAVSDRQSGALFFAYSILGCALVWLLVVTNLFASEHRRGARSLLQRVPSGFQTAFLVKLGMAIGLTLGAVVLGACLSVLLDGTESLRKVAASSWWPSLSIWIPPCAWLFATSAWARSSTISLGALYLVLLAAYLPLYFLSAEHADPEVISAIYQASTVVPIVVAWYAFVGGRRAGRSLRSSIVGSIAIAALSCLPVWGYGFFAHHKLSKTRWVLDEIYLGEGGRHAFLNLSQEFVTPRGRAAGDVYWAWHLDLETQVAKPIGAEARSRWIPPRAHLNEAFTLAQADGAPVIELLDDFDWKAARRDGDSRARVELAEPLRLIRNWWFDDEPDVLFALYDGRTGTLLSEPPQALVEELASEFGVTKEWRQEHEAQTLFWFGLGFRAGSVDDAVWLDPFREISLEQDLLVNELGVGSCYGGQILPAGWMVATESGQVLYDPLTGESSRVDELFFQAHHRKNELVLGTFEDGTLLMSGEEGLFLFDAMHRQRTDIACSLPWRDAYPVAGFQYGLCPPLDKSEPLLLIRAGTEEARAAVLHPESLELQPLTLPGEPSRLQASASIDQAHPLLLDARRVFEIDLETGVITVILDLDTVLDDFS